MIMIHYSFASSLYISQSSFFIYVTFRDDIVEGDEEESDDEESDDEEADKDSAFEAMSLGDKVEFLWNKRKSRLEHDYSIAGWALCVMPEVMDDCSRRMTGDHRDAIERVVKKLHTVPCPNNKAKNMMMPEILDTFWNEFKQFTSQTGWASNRARFNSPDALKGNSSAWHDKYSIPYTNILGYVACRVTSKILGIGAAERVWGDTKTIKSGKRKHLKGNSTEKRTVLYSSAKITQARIKRAAMERDTAGINTMFNDDDIK